MVCISFFGTEDTFKLLGNKATTSDLSFRHYNNNSFVKPMNDKAKTMIQAVNISDFVLIEVNEINKYLGELIILLSLLNKKGLFIVKKDKQYLINQLNSFKLNYDIKIISDNHSIKELKEELSNIKPNYGKDSLVIIDHFFTVKSVGTVALGFVKGGTIKAKEKFRLLPSNKQVQINSIQSMDVNYKEVNDNLRVGLALKNCSLNDIERGSVLSNVLEQVNEFSGEFIINKFYKKDLTKAMIINGLLNREAVFNNEKVSVTKPIVITGPTIIYSENESPRIIGIIKNTKPLIN